LGHFSKSSLLVNLLTHCSHSFMFPKLTPLQRVHSIVGIFLFIATYDAFSSEEVNYEIRRAKEMQKRIIPCKHACVRWSQVEEIGIYTQGIPFDTKEELIREIGPRLEKELGVIPTRSQVNNDTTHQQHKVRLPTKSNWWKIREIEQHLEDVSDLDEELANPAFFIGWLYRVDSSLKEMFGEKSKYYRNFPRFSLHELSDITLPFDYPNTRFKMAKKHLREILQEIKKVDDNNNSKH
jgi:hypothetical protein